MPVRINENVVVIAKVTDIQDDTHLTVELSDGRHVNVTTEDLMNRRDELVFLGDWPK